MGLLIWGICNKCFRLLVLFKNALYYIVRSISIFV